MAIPHRIGSGRTSSTQSLQYERDIESKWFHRNGREPFVGNRRRKGSNIPANINEQAICRLDRDWEEFPVPVAPADLASLPLSQDLAFKSLIKEVLDKENFNLFQASIYI